MSFVLVWDKCLGNCVYIKLYNKVRTIFTFIALFSRIIEKAFVPVEVNIGVI